MLSRDDIPVLGAIAVGGGIGALGRYGIGRWWPAPPGHIPWATLVINAGGCFFIGVLMVLITEVWAAHRLLRPFLGVGILGGFTTFSTYVVDIRHLLIDDRVVPAFAYLFATVLAALAAVMAGIAVTRTVSGAVVKVGKSDE